MKALTLDDLQTLSTALTQYVENTPQDDEDGALEFAAEVARAQRLLDSVNESIANVLGVMP